MSYLRDYLRRELQRIIDAVADPVARHTFSIGSDKSVNSATHTVLVDSVAGFLPSKDLTQHLTGNSVCESRTVVLLGVLNRVDDVYVALDGVANTWRTDSRLITISYNRVWRPLVRSMRLLTGRTTHLENWIPPDELDNLLEQSGFEIVERRTAVLIPFPVIGRLLNRWLAPLPILRLLCVYNIVIARPRRPAQQSEPSVSIIVAARNEEGNIGNLIQRLPTLSSRQELIFVEGGSQDDTWAAIQRIIGITNASGSVVSAHKQTGIGKGDAVRLGFAHATGDILIILDADLSVPPEELSRFTRLLRENSCEFANGSRLVYPMEKQAMQFLNLIGNRLFGITFSYLLGQPVRDTLCGTKALWASDYRRIADQRSHFGDFDPFGDFDLLFGAARLHLKIRDVPVHYKERVYGSTNISRFRHGLTLLRMTTVAARKLRFV